MSDDDPTGTYLFEMGSDRRWRESDGQSGDDAWAKMTLDIKRDPRQPNDEIWVDAPPPRPVEVIDGGMDDLIGMLSAADRLRARLLRRDLRWIKQVAGAAGYRIALVRKPREDD